MIIFLPLLLLIVVVITSDRAIMQRALPPTSPIGTRIDERLRRILFWLSFVLGIGGVIPLMGIPGEPWLLAAEPLAQRVCPTGSLGRFGADASWPSAMMIAMAWPACLLPVYRQVRVSTSRGTLIGRSAAGLALMAGYGVGLGLLMYLGYCRWP